MKRIFDIIISFLALILLTPFFILISTLIVIFMGRPIFFIQERVGKNCKIFRIFKFRTMNVSKSKKIDTRYDKSRTTKLGQFLRNYSLDELPEFINVLNGSMSLVGPRPLLVEYLSIYTDEQNRRHLIKPGITGMAQINGRNLLSWDETFQYDLYYVDNNNLLLDIKILLATVKKFFLKEGIDESHNKTKEKLSFKKDKKDL
tara:strand:+ start:72 stop:677 length:606 start_codon:yes stop_codon:yes gene_type:complete